MPGFSVHLFNTNGTDYDGEKGSGNFSIDGAFMAEFFINELFSLQTGLFFTADTMTIAGQKNVYDDSGNFKYAYDTAESFSTKSLVFPLRAGINFYPSIFSLGIHGGIYMDVIINSVYKDIFAETEGSFKRNVLFGWTAGGSAGITLGPGMMFFDIQYMTDFVHAKTTMYDTPVALYKRHIIAFAIGYKIGVINQKR
jgi:hypothetical protein